MAKLLPPTVGDRLARCGTHVEVWGIVSGAEVALEVGGVAQNMVVNGTATTFTVPPLQANAAVRARQRLGADASEWGNTVLVEDVETPPTPPLTELSVPGCAQCIRAWGAAPGSRVEITNQKQLVAEGEINRFGWACMSTRVKPVSGMQAAAMTCGQSSGAGGSIGTAGVPSPFPAPRIVEPVFECQTVVGLEGLFPGATVEVFVTDQAGVRCSLGTLCSCWDRVNAHVGRSMRAGDRLDALQFMVQDQWECRVRSAPSDGAQVVPPDARIKPMILTPVYEGDAVIAVANQIEGGAITLLSRADAQAPEEEQGSRPASEALEVPIPTPPLKAGQVLRVMQELCGVREFSDPVTVERLPATIAAPTIRAPLYGCAEIVAVDHVLPGATVVVLQTPANALAPEYPIGRVYAAGSPVIVPVAPRLLAGAFVSAYQEMGGQKSGRAPRVKAQALEYLAPPRVVAPVLVGSHSVWVENVAPGAHVRILDRGVQMGSGSLAETAGAIGVWWAIPDGATMTATQTLCQTESRPSAPRPAVSEAACDGPPAYDPAKWNDGGKVQACNNCYNYACDIRTDTFAQPGGSVGLPTCAGVTQGALSDGLRQCVVSQCHPCHHRVALVIWPSEDFHWYRQDVNGKWSHKPGDGTARDVDASQNPIDDPKDADRGPYTEFCGYFCVYKADVSISGWGCP